MTAQSCTRREFALRMAAGIVAGAALPQFVHGDDSRFRLRYIVGSCMYGTTPVAEILPEVAKTGAGHLDVWPRVHGNQREQMDEMGHEAFAALLEKHGVALGMLTRYDLGPFGLAPELKVARKFGSNLIITGSGGPKGLSGDGLKKGVRQFVEKMQPHVDAAEEHGVTIGIENHGNSLISEPDALRWLAEFNRSKHLGIAFAPYHLPQDPKLLAGLIGDLGESLVHFYAWEHGDGCMTKLPKEQELKQLPGRGPLDFAPLLAALKKIDYRGWTEVFMHPVPRGIPILETTAAVTTEINRSRAYLETCLAAA